MSTYYPKIKGSTICDANRNEIGSDNTNVTGWVMANPFIYCVAIGQDGRNPVAAAMRLEWRASGGEFAPLAATGALKYTTATDLTNGNAVVSAEAKVAVANMTWQDGEEVEDGLAASIDLANDGYSELQFAVDPSGASAGTIYEFQLYDTTLGAAVAIESGAMLTVRMAAAPTVTTAACDEVSFDSARGNGEITNTGGVNATRRGFCYMTGTEGDPTTANSVSYDDGDFGVETFTKTIMGLNAETNYRVRAYAINPTGTGYGTTVQLMTEAVPNIPPTVSPNTSDMAEFNTGTPTIEFTGVDPDGDRIRYHIQIFNGLPVWSEQTPAGDADKNWQSCSISGDKMIAGVDGGRLYYFNGATWSEQTPAGDADKYWASCSISGDKMIAGVWNGRLYYFNGATWSEQTPAGDADKYWASCSISGDKIIADVSYGRLYYFNGATWSEQTPAGDVDKNWASCSISGDKMIAAVYSGRLYYYDGNSWSEQQPAGDADKNWYACFISGDKMLAGVLDGRLYYYDGNSWSEVQPAGNVNKSWFCCSISGDKMLAGAISGRLYYYDGNSWSEQQPAGDADKGWYTCSISGDKMLAGVWNGRLYVYISSLFIDATSETPTLGFINTVNNEDTDPFTHNQKISYTVQDDDALADGTYYWRVRGIDP